LPEPGAPTRIGRYEIRQELGRGTMGVVYEAEDPALGRRVAVKTIQVPLAASKPEREEYEKRFLAEARIAARLSHSGIVVVHDVGRDADQDILYIALEHLQGRTLAEVAAEGPLGWRETLRIVGRLADAVRYAHAKGVVHRDIKPANIMLVASGEPKIMDFGIAKLEAGQLTSPGQFFGTPLYMSPEQALGQPVDGRTDLFSLGSVAYFLLSGRPPFEAPNVPGILARVAYQHPKPLRDLVPGLPADVEYVVTRAMAKNPTDRFPDGKTMGEDVEDILAGRPPRHREGWTPPPVGTGTVASGRGEELPELALDAIEVPPLRRRRRGRTTFTLVALLGLVPRCISTCTRPTGSSGAGPRARRRSRASPTRCGHGGGAWASNLRRRRRPRSPPPRPRHRKWPRRRRLRAPWARPHRRRARRPPRSRRWRRRPPWRRS
jgi:serine/threonine protein kinase